MSQHHTETLRFERVQSRPMREAEWDERLPPIRPLWQDILAAIGLTLSIAILYLLATVM